MVIMKPGHIFKTASLLMVLSGCSNLHTNVRQGFYLAEDKPTVKTIAILPPEVTFTQKQSLMNVRDEESERAIRNGLVDAAERILGQHGYITNDRLISKWSKTDPAFEEKYRKFRAAHESAMKWIYAKDPDGRNLIINLGPSARVMSDAAGGVDALLAINFAGFNKTKSRVVVEDTAIVVGAVVAVAVVAHGVVSGDLPVLSGGGGGTGNSQTDAHSGKSNDKGNAQTHFNPKLVGDEECIIEASLIDGKSGQLLWADFGKNAEDNFKTKDTICRINLENVLKKVTNRIPRYVNNSGKVKDKIIQQ